MAGLLAAQQVSVLAHVLRHILVAHGGLLIADAQLIQGLVEAHVGHDGGDHLALAQLALVLHVLGAEIQDLVAVDHFALLVHREAPVRVPVEGKADVQELLPHQLLELLQMGGAAVHVDVQAVGPVADHIGIGAQGVKHALGHHPGAAVGAVQADPVALIGAGGQADQVADVAVAAGGVVHGLADVGIGGVGQLLVGVQIGLDAGQHRLLHLLPLGVDELDAVVVIGVVAGGDHDAAVKIVRAGDVGDAGGAGDVQQVRVRAGGGEPGAEGAFKHVAGAAGILADDHHGLVGLAVVPAQVPPDAESMIDGQALVGLSAETVGPEVFTHV